VRRLARLPSVRQRAVSKTAWIADGRTGSLAPNVLNGASRDPLTQIELARLLRKPQSFVSAFEAGKRRVDLIEFLLITRTLGAHPLDIFAEIASSLPK